MPFDKRGGGKKAQVWRTKAVENWQKNKKYARALRASLFVESHVATIISCILICSARSNYR